MLRKYNKEQREGYARIFDAFTILGGVTVAANVFKKMELNYWQLIGLGVMMIVFLVISTKLRMY